MINGSVRRSFVALLVSSAAAFVVYSISIKYGFLGTDSQWQRPRYDAPASLDQQWEPAVSHLPLSWTRPTADPAPRAFPLRPVIVEEVPTEFSFAAEHEPGTGLKGASGCQKRFARSYERFCQRALSHPKPSNIPPEFKGRSVKEHLCPCVPSNLKGRGSLRIALEKNLSELEHSSRTGELTAGGRWRPTACVARQRVAILVPYRNREKHLISLLKVLHLTLRRQLLDFTIFVVEQAAPLRFNRGALLNVGFKESLKFGPFDCLMLHDVDMLPYNDLNFYTCSWGPRHVGRFRDHRIFDYKDYFGGIVAITPGQFSRINGFSNSFYGWGGEDDDFLHRWKGREYRPSTYKHQGLNNLRYKLVNVTLMNLYTNITVVLPSLRD